MNGQLQNTKANGSLKNDTWPGVEVKNKSEVEPYTAKGKMLNFSYMPRGFTFMIILNDP